MYFYFISSHFINLTILLFKKYIFKLIYSKYYILITRMVLYSNHAIILSFNLLEDNVLNPVKNYK